MSGRRVGGGAGMPVHRVGIWRSVHRENLARGSFRVVLVGADLDRPLRRACDSAPRVPHDRGGRGRLRKHGQCGPGLGFATVPGREATRGRRSLAPLVRVHANLHGQDQRALPLRRPRVVFVHLA